MGILTNIGGGLSLESTTVETGTTALPAGKTARIVPKTYRADLVIDGNIVLHQLAINTQSSTPNTAYDATTIPKIGLDGAEVVLTLGLAITNISHTASYIITDFYGTIVSTGTSNTLSYTNKLLNFPWRNDYVLSIKTSNGTATAQSSMILNVASVTEREFFAYGGVGGINIDGDEYLMEIYG